MCKMKKGGIQRNKLRFSWDIFRRCRKKPMKKKRTSNETENKNSLAILSIRLNVRL